MGERYHPLTGGQPCARCARLEAEMAKVQERTRSLQEALTPTAATKAAYIGEFSVPLPEIGEDGVEYQRRINVPWTTIKAIMAAIIGHAAVREPAKPAA